MFFCLAEWPKGARLALSTATTGPMSPGGRTVIVYQADESFSIFDLLLVAELTVDPPVLGTAPPPA